MPSSVIRTPDGHELGCYAEQIPIHYLTKPSDTWRFTDAAGHDHHRNPGDPAGHNDWAHDYYPTLTEVADYTYTDEDGEPVTVTHLECKLCGETIHPAMTGPGVDYIAGPMEWTYDGQPIPPDQGRAILAGLIQIQQTARDQATAEHTAAQLGYPPDFT